MGFPADDEVDIPTFPVEDLLPNSTRYDYYRYYGSLTTPPCYESVIWSFGADKIEISAEQVSDRVALYLNQYSRISHKNWIYISGVAKNLNLYSKDSQSLLR